MKNNLKTLRTQAGLTQDELAAMVGVTKQYLSALERGVNKISGTRLAVIQAMCGALGCTKEDLTRTNEFLLDVNGQLIVDGLYNDSRYPASIVVVIDGRNYLLPNSFLYQKTSAENELTPLVNSWHLADNAEKLPQYLYRLFRCVPKDGFRIEVGRAITEQEFADFKAKHKVKDSDVSEPFVAVKGEFYGEDSIKNYMAVQVTIEKHTSKLARELNDSGIEAKSVAPYRLNIRVK